MGSSKVDYDRRRIYALAAICDVTHTTVIRWKKGGKVRKQTAQALQRAEDQLERRLTTGELEPVST